MELHVSLPAEFEICVLWSSLPTPSHSVFLFRLATLALTTCPLKRSLKNDTTCRSSSQHGPEGLPGSSASLDCSFSTPATSSPLIPPRRLRVASLSTQRFASSMVKGRACFQTTPTLPSGAPRNVERASEISRAPMHRHLPLQCTRIRQARFRERILHWSGDLPRWRTEGSEHKETSVAGHAELDSEDACEISEFHGRRAGCSRWRCVAP